MSSLFVAFEGIDASGKATQSKMLTEMLKGVLYSFPSYETPMGRLIAAHLQNEWVARMYEPQKTNSTLRPDEVKILDAVVFQSLMLTNRMEKAVGLRKHLKEGKSVICDRYWASGYAYGKADGVDPDYLVAIHDFLPKPDLQILIDIDPADSVKRRPDRRDRYEKQAGLMETVAQNYRELWDKKSVEEPNRWVVVNGRKTVSEVGASVWSSIVSAMTSQRLDSPFHP